MTRAWILAVALAGCGEPASAGLDEPIRVRGGSLHDGPLPDDDGGPAVTAIESASAVITLGEATKRLAGHAATDAVAIGLAFAGEGAGYWVVPVGPADPTAGDQYTWTADTSIGWDLPLGAGALDVVAIDADGRAGPTSSLAVCVTPQLPDNLNACDATIAPPDAVLSLAWDADVDLDLQVRTPDGKLVDAAHPSTVLVGDDGVITPAELHEDHVGLLDRDSNGACVIDGVNREDLVWQTSPRSGTYLVYANLADACGAAAVRFTVTLYRAEDGGDGTSRLVEAARAEGRLVGASANGGAGPGLFVLQLGL